MSKVLHGTVLRPEVACMVTGGKWARGEPEELGDPNFDSRIIKPGEVFLALRAARDGHDFAQAAKEAGASAAIVEREVDCDMPQLVVPDTYRALLDLAHWRRANYKGALVMVTGSSGKSTTKEMIGCAIAAFAGQRSTVVSAGSYHNHLGLPLTLMRLRPEHEYAVLEAGMNKPGEIGKLARLARPTMGVITNAGRAHLGHFESEEQIARAKGELIATMGSDSPVILNTDDKYFPLWRSMARHLDVVGFSHSGDRHAVCRRTPDRDFLFRFSGSSTLHEVNLQVTGGHNEQNALAAAAAAWRLGVPMDAVCRGLEDFSGVPGRHEIVHLGNAVLINDSYNASPESFLLALEELKRRPESHKILVMGDMLELGEHAAGIHEQVVRVARDSGVSEVLAFGEHSSAAASVAGGHGYSSKDELVKAARRLMDDNCVVLIKGSRGMHMEEVAHGLAEG